MRYMRNIFFWDSQRRFRQCQCNNLQGTNFDHFDIKNRKAGMNRIYR